MPQLVMAHAAPLLAPLLGGQLGNADWSTASAIGMLSSPTGMAESDPDACARAAEVARVDAIYDRDAGTWLTRLRRVSNG